MFPGRPGATGRVAPGGGLGHGGEAQRGGVPPRPVEDMAGPEQHFASSSSPRAAQSASATPPAPSRAAHAEVRPDDGQVEQVVAELMAWIAENQGVCPAAPAANRRDPRGLGNSARHPSPTGRGGRRPIPRPQPIDELVEAAGLLQAVRQPEDPGQFLPQSFSPGNPSIEGGAPSQGPRRPG